tara:strand:- start:1345 stop:2538 length:1194 start_codon:yes stop_codon:yes gene_type:complete
MGSCAKKEKIKVLLVNNLYHPFEVGGAEKSVKSLCEKLPKEHFDIGVLSLTNKMDSYETINGIKIWRLKSRNIYWPFKSKSQTRIKKIIWHVIDRKTLFLPVKVKNILKEFNPHIIHTNNLSGISTSIWKIASKRKIPVIHTLRDYYLMCPKSTMFKALKSCSTQCVDCEFFSKKQKKLSNIPSVVVGISQRILDIHLSNGYFSSSEKLVIYNGFSINKSTHPTTHSTPLKIGFIGQLNRAKGFDTLVNALSTLTHYDWRLLIAGNYLPKQKVDTNKKIPKEKVAFLGFVKQKSFFEKVDFLVVPSIWEEPFGRVIIESFLMNTPVIASNIGGIPELFQSNKQFLFEPNKHSLIDILTKILDKPKTSLSTFDFKISDKYLIEKTAASYVNLYKGLLK